MRLTDHKRRDRRHVEGAQLQRAVAEPIGQEPPQHIGIVRHGDWCEPSLGCQVVFIVALQLAERGLVNYRDRGLQLASCSEMGEKLMDCRRVATV